MRLLMIDLGPEWRGGQRQTLLLARGLAARGHEVTLAARSGSPLERAAVDSPGVVAAGIRAGSEAAPAVLVDLARAARASRPEIVYAGDSRGHGAAIWSRARRDRPLVVHRRVIFAPRANFLSRRKYAGVDRFVAVSGAARASLVAFGVPPERIEVVPDGLPPEAFVRADPLPPPPPHRLVHVGAFDGKKGQEIVVEALAALVGRGREVVAEFLGDGAERRRVESLASRLGLRDRCAFPGVVTDVPARLARSHLLLLPSASEGAPLAVVEAMAAGCPVLAHDVGGIAEITRGGEAARLLDSLEVSRWAEAIAELLDAPERVSSLVEAGRRIAAERTIERTVEVVERVLAVTLASVATR